jgi:predicted phosphoadenosine phosphosulfate sulfurtransferase
MPKTRLGVDVLTAARQRIADTFDQFPRVYVSFSAGKDSTVMLHLVADEARRRGRSFGVLLVDLEGQYRLTIEHAEACLAEYADVAERGQRV